MSKLRVGYILDEGDQPNAVFDLVEKSKASEHYSIDLLIVQRTAKGRPRNAVSILRGRPQKRLGRAWRICLQLCAGWVCICRSAKYAHHSARGLDRSASNERRPKCPERLRYLSETSGGDQERNLDVLIRGGSGIMRGGALNVSVWHSIVSTRQWRHRGARPALGSLQPRHARIVFRSVGRNGRRRHYVRERSRPRTRTC